MHGLICTLNNNYMQIIVYTCVFVKNVVHLPIVLLIFIFFRTLARVFAGLKPKSNEKISLKVAPYNRKIHSFNKISEQ